MAAYRSILAAVFAVLCMLAPVRFGWSAERPIYRCELDGVLTFSDQPCGAAAIPYEPDAARVSTYEAPAVAKTKSRPQRAKIARRTTSDSIAAAQRERGAECDRVGTQLREIRSKMRAGYSAKEGERLRARERKLNERRRAARCP